ncbi:MAG: cytochrome d ubiquinol oxidase subunit II [Thermomicrobiales bacterium]
MPWYESVQSLEFILGGILLLGVILYAVLGGADFGGGVWDLLARGPRANQQREVIAHAIGPIWEVNHVWLIFVIVLVFTIFPPVYAALSVALFIPLTLALLGIVFRGAAFVFRTPARSVAVIGGVWDRVFAIASVVTPVFFGMAAGAVAGGQIRVIDGVVQSDPVFSWLAPFPGVIGLLALATCAFLAAVYLTVETTGSLQEDFRRRALGAGAVFAVLAAAALPLARRDAPQIWDGLTGTGAIAIVPLGLLLAVATGWAVFTRHYRLARYTAVGEVALLLTGWALAQYPYLVVPDLTFENAAATPAMLRAALITFGIGSLVLVPSLALLFRVFKADLPGGLEVREE